MKNIQIHSGHFLSFLFLFCGVSTFAQTTVDINLNVKHITGGISEFDRKKFITMHASLTEGEWDSDAQRDEFLELYDVYLGRNNGTYPWELNQTKEDPGKPGWPSLDDMAIRGMASKNNYAAKTAVHKHEHRSDLMIGGQPVMYPNGDPTTPCCGNATPWVVADYEALAEYMANLLTEYYGTGGVTGEPKPTFIEVMNEPFVHAWEIPTTKANISELHNVVANRIHALHPEVKVGGYTAAHPAFEANNFKHWEGNWKLFMDMAGENMDFFSVHIYDFAPPDNPNDEKHRSGSNAEAILDMIAHYSHLSFGEVKPFVISEYGYFAPGLDGTPYAKTRDWGNLRSFSTMMMQFMEKPDIMAKTVPFMILKANWWSHPSGNKYPYRLMRQQKELAGETGEAWVYTELVKFYELWSDVKGTRVDTRPTDLDIQADAYVSGKKAYVIINNLHFEPHTVKLKIFDALDNPIEKIDIKHLHLVDELPLLETSQHDGSLSEVTIDAEATMILAYTFANEVTVDHTSNEQRFFADKYYHPILANVENTFSINGISKGSEGEAVIRLGLGRDHTNSLQPVIKFNDTPIAVPTNWRGYDQHNRDRFFGVIEIPVPYELLQENNTLSVKFDDAGGHISSVSMQTFKFSKKLQRTENSGAVLSANRSDLDLQIKVYPNPAEKKLTLSLPKKINNATLYIQNLKGVTLLKKEAKSGANTIEMNNLARGMYLVLIQTDHQMFTRKIRLE